MSKRGDALAIIETVDDADTFIGNFGGQPGQLPFQTLVDHLNLVGGGGAANAAALSVAPIGGLFATDAQAAFAELVSKISVEAGARAGADTALGVLTTALAAADTAEANARIAADALKAPLLNPVFTGAPTTPSPASNDNSQKIAPTTWVLDRVTEAINGINPKNPVRVIVQPSALASGCENGDTQDGVVLATGNRILCQQITSGLAVAHISNGAYIVQASGAAVRSTDTDSGAEMKFATILVLEGTYAGSTWTAEGTTPVIGTDTVLFTQRTSVGGGGGVTYTADGSTIALAGNQFSVLAIPTSKVTGLDAAQTTQTNNIATNTAAIATNVTDIAARALKTRLLNTTGLVTGGGDLQADRTLNVTEATSGNLAESTTVMTPRRVQAANDAWSKLGYKTEILTKPTTLNPTFAGSGSSIAAAWVFNSQANMGAVPGFTTGVLIHSSATNGVDGGTVPTLSCHQALFVTSQAGNGATDWLTITDQGEVGTLRVQSLLPMRSDQGSMLIDTRRRFNPISRPGDPEPVSATFKTDGGSNSVEGKFALVDKNNLPGVEMHYYIGGFALNTSPANQDMYQKMRGFVVEAIDNSVYGLGAAFSVIDNPAGAVGVKWAFAAYNTRADLIPYAGVTGYDHPKGPGRILAGNGTVANPSISFVSSADGAGTGFYKTGNGFGASINGVLHQEFAIAGYMMNGSQVVGPRDTGWAAMTGTPVKTTIATYGPATATGTYNQAQLQAVMNVLERVSKRMMAYDAMLLAHGLIGA